MYFKLDFKRLNKYIDKLETVEETIAGFRKDYNELIEEIGKDNKAKAYEKLADKSQETLEQLKKVEETAGKMRDTLDKYVNDIQDKNPVEGDESDYRFDTSKYYWEIDNLCKDIDYDIMETDNVYNDEKDEFRGKIVEYDNVNNYINIDIEYKDDIETANYIKRRQEEIEDDIRNYKSNQELAEEMYADIRDLNKKVDDYREYMYKELEQVYPEDMENVENKYYIKDKIEVKKVQPIYNANGVIIDEINPYAGINDISDEEREYYFKNKETDLSKIKIPEIGKDYLLDVNGKKCLVKYVDEDGNGIVDGISITLIDEDGNISEDNNTEAKCDRILKASLNAIRAKFPELKNYDDDYLSQELYGSTYKEFLHEVYKHVKGEESILVKIPYGGNWFKKEFSSAEISKNDWDKFIFKIF